MLRQLPNAITALRIILLPFFAQAVYGGDRPAALVLLGVIAFSDALDGWLARRFRLVTPLGAFLDPLADKLAQVTALILLALDLHDAFTPIPIWFVALVFSRELMLAYGALRIKHVVIRTRVWGKLSTTLVFVMVFGALLGLGDLFMTIMLVLTTPVVLTSAATYAYDGRRQLVG